MKKLLLFALLLAPAAAIADNYLTEGTSWTTRLTGEGDGDDLIVSIENYTISGDTIVDGVSALKVYNVENILSSVLVAVIRNEDDKVYTLSGTTNQWLLAYDFSMKEGDVREISKFDAYSAKQSNDARYYVKCVSISTSEQYGGWPVMHYKVCGLGGRLLSIEKDGEVICQYEMDSLGDTAAESMSVSVDGMAVSVAGAEAGCEVRAYAANGALAVRAAVSSDGRATLTLPRSGLYLIATPGGSAKVMAR